MIDVRSWIGPAGHGEIVFRVIQRIQSRCQVYKTGPCLVTVDDYDADNPLLARGADLLA